MRWILLDYLDDCIFEKGSHCYHIKLNILKKLSKDNRYYIRNAAIFARNKIINKKAIDSKREFESFLSGKMEYKTYLGPSLFDITQKYIKEFRDNNYEGYNTDTYELFVKNHVKEIDKIKHLL